DNPWASVPGRILVERGHMPPPEPGAPGIFSMSDRDRIKALVKAAGFGKVKVHDMHLEWRFEGFDDYWGFLIEVAGGVALVIEKLSDEERVAFRGTLAD